MARRKTLAKFVRDLKPADGRRTVPVPGIAGLYCRLHPSGRKTFTIVVRPKGSKRQLWRELPLVLDMDNLTAADEAEVQALTREGLLRGRAGEDPFPPPPAEPDSLQVSIENWLRRSVRKNGLVSADKIEARLRRLVFPALGKEPATGIKRQQIAGLLDQIEDRNGGTMAQRIYEDLTTFFGWLEGRDDTFSSPMVKALRRKTPGNGKRRRALSDAEIRALWRVAPSFGAFGHLCQLLLLSAQRLEKVQQMRWQDIDSHGVWRIPKGHDREKANARVVPLPKMALDILETLPRVVNNPFVFASDRTDHYFRGVGNAKKAIDARILDVLKAEDPGAELPPWQLHGLRHSSKTLLARAGVSSFDSERCLGHTIPGVEGRYDHHDYQVAIGRALEKLAAEVQKVTGK